MVERKNELEDLRRAADPELVSPSPSTPESVPPLGVLDEDVMVRKHCPHCGGDLLRHAAHDPIKGGALHCNSCGCCFLPNLKALRPGNVACVRKEEAPRSG